MGLTGSQVARSGLAQAHRSVHALAKEPAHAGLALATRHHFDQSADLFQGLNFDWPLWWRQFCKHLASIDSSVNLLKTGMSWAGLNLDPECQFQIEYSQQWIAMNLSPFIVIFIYYFVVVLYLLIADGLGCRRFTKAFNKGLLMCWFRYVKPTRSRASNINERLLGQPPAGSEPAGEQDRMNDGAREKLEHGWQFRVWKDGVGHWKDYDAGDQEVLDQAKSEGSHHVELRRGQFKFIVSMQKLEQVNESTGKTRKIRAPARGCWYRYRVTQALVEHSWYDTLRGCRKLLMMYLLVGYTMIARNSLEPLACDTVMDSTQWMHAQPAIACDSCSNTIIPGLGLTYRWIAALSVAFFMIWGFGIPLSFAGLLRSKRKVLQTNAFARDYGFLASKMKTEYFWWEMVVLIRRLMLVVITKFFGGNGETLQCAVLNLLVTIMALVGQIFCWPFANSDANWAETFTLLATILIIVLGLAQENGKSMEAGLITADEENDITSFLDWVGYGIGAAMAGLLGASFLIVLRRMRGAFYNWQHLRQLENAEDDGRQIPDEVRTMLHKKWLLVASSWAAIKATHGEEDFGASAGVPLLENDRVRLVDGTMGRVKEVNPGGRKGKYIIELAAEHHEESEAVHVGEADTESRPLESHAAVDRDRLRLSFSRLATGSSLRHATTTTVTRENREVSREDVVKEGDIQRISRMFEKLGQQKDTVKIKKWETQFQLWDDFFPEEDRRAMYILGATAEMDDLEDMLWMMQVLKDMEREQLDFCPKWCTRKEKQLRDILKERDEIRHLTDTQSVRLTTQLGRTPLLEPGDAEESPPTTFTTASRRGSQVFRLLERDAQLRAQQEQQPATGHIQLFAKQIEQLFFATSYRVAVFVLMCWVSVFITIFALDMIYVSHYSVSNENEGCQDDWDMGGDVLLVYWACVTTTIPLILLYLHRVRPYLKKVDPMQSMRATLSSFRASNAGYNYATCARKFVFPCVDLTWLAMPIVV